MSGFFESFTKKCNSVALILDSGFLLCNQEIRLGRILQSQIIENFGFENIFTLVLVPSTCPDEKTFIFVCELNRDWMLIFKRVTRKQ